MRIGSLGGRISFQCFDIPIHIVGNTVFIKAVQVVVKAACSGGSSFFVCCSRITVGAVVSALLIIDSVNLLLNNFVHSPEESELYEKYFSLPFEQSCLSLFKKNGFDCGEVSSQGVWKNGAEMKLINKKPMPGQIDILAILPKAKIAIIADCKLLHYPHSSNRLRNINLKVGDSDADGFYKKLRKKTKWLTECQNLPLAEFTTYNILITNRFIPFSTLSSKKIITYNQLEAYLENGTPISDWETRVNI